MPQARKPDESQSQSEGEDEQAKRAREVASSPEEAQSDAEAPGPITPEHESGSWEQTKREQEAQEKAREEGGKSS
jgi:hypothetical protein